MQRGDLLDFIKETCGGIDTAENDTRTHFQQLLSLYKRRFPELETLPLTAVQYSNIVLGVGKGALNQPEAFKACLPQALALAVSVSAATSKGQELNEVESHEAIKMATRILQLDSQLKSSFALVEDKVNLLAPNLSVLVGPRIAALMLVAAGSLREMSKIPAGNIANLGAKEYLSLVYSNTTLLPSQKRYSLLELTDFCRGAEHDHKKIALRLLAAKVVLAVRSDLAGSSSDGSLGREYLGDIQEKYEKRIEPAPLKAPRPLPVPDFLPKKRRGGRRVRKMKELLKVTEMRQLQNRVAFGQAEEEVIVGEEIKGLGMSTSKRSVVDSRLSDYIKKSGKTVLSRKPQPTKHQQQKADLFLLAPCTFENTKK